MEPESKIRGAGGTPGGVGEFLIGLAMAVAGGYLLTNQEVARVLGSSQTTVRSQICSARAKIKLYRDRYLKRGLRGSNT